MPESGGGHQALLLLLYQPVMAWRGEDHLVLSLHQAVVAWCVGDHMLLDQAVVAWSGGGRGGGLGKGRHASVSGGQVRCRHTGQGAAGQVSIK